MAIVAHTEYRSSPPAIDTDAARATLQRVNDESLDAASLGVEIDHWLRQRALLLGDIAAQDFADSDEATLLAGVAFADVRLAALARQAERHARAMNLPGYPATPPRQDLTARFQAAKSVDLVSLIEHLTGQAVVMRGRYHYAACPWHDDRNPSLIIYAAPRGFWCPVCHITGDAVTFVARMNAIPAVEALELVEALTGTGAATSEGVVS
jgi:hypothetical protein